MKVADLSGALLDFWIARAEGWEIDPHRPPSDLQIRTKGSLLHAIGHLNGSDGFTYALCGVNRPYSYSPSTDWAIGGPIIERESISTVCWQKGKWSAYVGEQGPYLDATPGWDEDSTGETALIASMRAYVASRFGAEVPDTLEG